MKHFFFYNIPQYLINTYKYLSMMKNLKIKINLKEIYYTRVNELLNAIWDDIYNVIMNIMGSQILIV